MTSAYVLILAMLVLGGLLATLGDRLGTKVGKARLSLFNLRPRQTATVVTIVTGILISSSTLGILFATSKSLRVGIFRLDEKLKDLRQARKELTNVTIEKTQVEQALAEAKTKQTQAQQQLDEIDEYLQDAINRQTETAAKLNQSETKLSQIQTEFQRATTQLSVIESQYQRAQSQLDTFSDQAQTLRQEIQELQAERQELLHQKKEVQVQIAQRDQEIAKRQLEIEQRDAEITQQQRQIAEQEAQIAETQSQIVQQEAQIAEKQSQIVQQEAQIAETQNKIVQQEAQISQREAQITEQEAQITEQDSQISQQTAEITKQQEQIARRQAEIDQRDRVIAEREKLLEELEKQQAFLERDIENLELNFQFLREGNVAILRNQVLASGVVRVLKPSGARQAAEELLREANLAAIESIRPGTNTGPEQVVQITPTEFERLVDEINDGRAYVVRILASANYLVGENLVQVFADAALNKIVFFRGEILAGTSVSPGTMTEEELRERIDLLLASASFRARRAGILAGPIEIAEGRLTLLEFIEQLQQYNEEVIVQAIASDVTYTAGPLKINLVVIQDKQILFNN